jgi:hypothetical protein
VRGIVLGSDFERGRVLITASEIQGGATEIPQRANYRRRLDLLDAAIRRSILYFDVIEWPRTNIAPQDAPGFELLEQQGYIARQLVEIDRSPFRKTPRSPRPALS